MICWYTHRLTTLPPALTLAFVLMAAPPSSAHAGWQVRIGADRISAVESSGALEGHPAEHLVDGRGGRAWVADTAAGAPSVTLRFSEMCWISRVDLLGGHAGNNYTYRRYARPLAVELSWQGGRRRFPVAESRAVQTIDLEELVVTRWLRLTVVDWTGDAGAGVALSEVALYAPGDVSEADPALSDRIAAAVARLGDEDTASAARADLVSYGERAVGPLMQLIARDGAAQAFDALRALHEIGGRTATSLVGRLLASRSVDDQKLALRLLSERPMDRFLAEIDELARRSEDVAVRAVALHIAGQLGDRRLERLVEAGLKSGEPALVDEAVTWIPSLGERGRALALELVSCERGEVRLAAVAALGQVAPGSPAVRRALQQALGDPHPAVSAAALRALRESHDPAVVPLLVERVVTAKRDRVARAAVRSLLDMGDGPRELLLARLRELPQARGELLLRELARDPSPATARVFARLVDSEFGHTHFPIVAELFDAHGEIAVAELMRLMKRDAGRLRQSEFFLLERAARAAGPARRALVALGRDTRWLPLEQARTRDRFIALLLDVVKAARDAEAADAVVSVYDNPTSFDRRLRTKAIETLGYLAPSEASSALIMRHVDDRRSRYHQVALMAAARLELKAALPAVWERLQATRARDWEPEVVAAVGALGGPEEHDHLFRAYAYANPRAQRAILEAAHRVRTPRAIALLVEAAASYDHRTRRMASALLVDD